jgi:hypothetical protein
MILSSVCLLDLFSLLYTARDDLHIAVVRRLPSIRLLYNAPLTAMLVLGNVTCPARLRDR